MIPHRFFWLFDVLTLSLAFLAAYFVSPAVQSLMAAIGFLRIGWLGALSPLNLGWLGIPPSIVDLLWILLMSAPPTILFMDLFHGYTDLLKISRTRIVMSCLFAPLVGLSLVTLVLFALKVPSWSRMFAFLFVLLSSLGLFTFRIGMRAYFKRRQAMGSYAKNTVLIGSAATLRWMEQYFKKNVAPVDYNLLGYLRIPFDPSTDDAGQEDAGLTLPCLGDVHELGDRLVHRPIHEVIAIPPTTGSDWLKQIIHDCDYFRITLSILTEELLFTETSDLLPIHRQDALGLPAVVLTPLHWDSEALFLKRLLDVLVAAFSLIVLSPLFAAIAMAIKITTPHLPILYPWRVVGRNGVEFTGYKFTTMIAGAEERKAELELRNEMTGPVFKIKDDPRITPLGRFLRKFSLNELPQLWSVLKGDMSLVGPRPAFRHELERYEMWHKRKLSIRPGMTCLWQVRGRNQVSNFDDWVKMDLEYIDHWSLWLDFRILLRTAWEVLAGTGS